MRKTKNEKLLIGRRLKGLRKAKLLTQDQLAESANLSSKYLSRIELGLENPTIDVFLRIANALNIPLTEMFRADHEEPDPDKLRALLVSLTKGADDKSLKLAVKLVQAVLC
ncbi:MAG: helix-turn-helix transcriptional regulator [Nitrospinae bacterium]|nr:helix-turn-helix transcriptional regulator [Nitrospinota bacterium]